MVEDYLMELSDPEYKKNLNTLIVDINQREMQIFDKEQILIYAVQTQVNSYKYITKLEKKLVFWRKSFPIQRIPKTKKLH